MKSGVEFIAQERWRQENQEDFSRHHDDLHVNDELAVAAVHYALPERLRPYPAKDSKPTGFPWLKEWWKPSPEDRIKELTKAGALIAAEIDRLQRIKRKETE